MEQNMWIGREQKDVEQNIDRDVSPFCGSCLVHKANLQERAMSAGGDRQAVPRAPYLRPFASSSPALHDFALRALSLDE
jgi:hypothetical protein